MGQVPGLFDPCGALPKVMFQAKAAEAGRSTGQVLQWVWSPQPLHIALLFSQIAPQTMCPLRSSTSTPVQMCSSMAWSTSHTPCSLGGSTPLCSLSMGAHRWVHSGPGFVSRSPRAITDHPPAPSQLSPPPLPVGAVGKQLLQGHQVPAAKHTGILGLCCGSDRWSGLLSAGPAL